MTNPGDGAAQTLHVEGRLPQPSTRSTELREIGRELVRGGLAILFAIILIGTIVFAFQHVGTPSWVDTKELLQLLLPAETALLGSATGFYFAASR